MSNTIITTVRIDKSLPNKIQLANINYEAKSGKKRHMYEFITEAIEAKLKAEGIKP